jgi:serine/threonine-protein kinase
VEQLMRAHVAVAAAGFVAVDLYDGCVLYDFETRRIGLIDLDMYRLGPFVLALDRQYGSETYMAPEEWTRGATIDERTTVFALGRFAQVLLGCHRHLPADRDDFRGTDGLWDVAAMACRRDPTDRVQSVAELHAAWSRSL